jgi:hypothetical protein
MPQRIKKINCLGHDLCCFSSFCSFQLHDQINFLLAKIPRIELSENKNGFGAWRGAVTLSGTQ